MNKRIPSFDEFINENSINESFTDDIMQIAKNNYVLLYKSDAEFYIERYLSGFLQYMNRNNIIAKLDKKRLDWLAEIYADANGQKKNDVLDIINKLKSGGSIKWITQRDKN